MIKPITITTKYETVCGDYGLCKWIDEHYGCVEIITVVKPDPMSSYKVFYREITQPITNEEQ